MAQHSYHTLSSSYQLDGNVLTTYLCIVHRVVLFETIVGYMIIINCNKTRFVLWFLVILPKCLIERLNTMSMAQFPACVSIYPSWIMIEKYISCSTRRRIVGIAILLDALTSRQMAAIWTTFRKYFLYENCCVFTSNVTAACSQGYIPAHIMGWQGPWSVKPLFWEEYITGEWCIDGSHYDYLFIKLTQLVF